MAFVVPREHVRKVHDVCDGGHGDRFGSTVAHLEWGRAGFEQAAQGDHSRPGLVELGLQAL
jgi:hypothetical protein